MDADYYRQQRLAGGSNKNRNLYKTVVSHNTIVLMWLAGTNMTACTLLRSVIQEEDKQTTHYFQPFTYQVLLIKCVFTFFET